MQLASIITSVLLVLCTERRRMQVKTDMISHWWSAFPLCMKACFTACVAIFLVSSIVRFSWNVFCLSWPHFSWAALILSPFSHADLLHLLFNMLALISVGTHVERLLGTGPTFAIVTALIVASEAMFLGVSVASSSFNCVLGFSGVLFGLFGIEAELAPRGSSASFCGLFNMDVRVMPWFLLLLSFLLFPSSSFVGHLSGLLAGLAIIHLVSDTAWARVGSVFASRPWIANRDGFVPHISFHAGSSTFAGSPFPEIPATSPPGPLVAGQPFVPFSGAGHKLGDPNPRSSPRDIV